MEAQDPDQLELPEKDEVDPLLEQKTILRPEIEDALEQDQPATLSWLQSLQGFVVQYGIVLIAVFLNIYELVLKPKAAEAMNSQSYGYTWKQQMWKPTAGATQEQRDQFAKKGAWPMYNGETPLGSWELKTGNVVSSWSFDNSEIMFWNAVLSIVLGLVLAAYNRKLGFLFSKESAKMCLIFQPAAIGFALSQFLGFFNLRFLAADVMKVLDQSRLLVTAVVMMFLLRKSYSRATWNSLIVITLAAVIYGNVNTLTAGSAGSGSPNLPVGMIFVLVNATVTALAGVWAEKYMKAYKSTPFYIQKLYLEVGNMFVQLIFLYVANPLMNSEKANIMTKLGFNPASGLFSNPYMMPLLWVFFIKNYMQGILVKRMSSLVKQLSAVVATALCYFFLIIHNTGCTPVAITKYTPSEPWKNVEVPNKHFDSFSKTYDSKFDGTDLKLDKDINVRRNQWLVKLEDIDSEGLPVTENTEDKDEKVPVAVSGYKGADAKEWEHKPSKATMTLDSTILKDIDEHSAVVSGTNKFFCLQKSLNMYIVLADLLVLFAVVSYIF